MSSKAATGRTRIRNQFGAFAQIPADLVKDPDISDRAIRVYALLWTYSSEKDREAYPSRKKMAEELEVSIDTIDRGIGELARRGAITVEEVFDGPRQTSNLYTIVAPLPDRDTEEVIHRGRKFAAGGGGPNLAALGGRKFAAPRTRTRRTRVNRSSPTGNHRRDGDRERDRTEAITGHTQRDLRPGAPPRRRLRRRRHLAPVDVHRRAARPARRRDRRRGPPVPSLRPDRLRHPGAAQHRPPRRAPPRPLAAPRRRDHPRSRGDRRATGGLLMTGQPRTDLEVSGFSHPTADTWVLHFPYAKNPLPMNGSRGHHLAHARKVRQYRQIAGFRARAAKIPSMGRCEVQLVWWVGTAGRRDPANLAAFEKPLFDALVDVAIVPDDTPQFMDTPRAEIRPVKQGAGFVTEPGFTLHIRRLVDEAEWEDD